MGFEGTRFNFAESVAGAVEHFSNHWNHLAEIFPPDGDELKFSVIRFRARGNLCAATVLGQVRNGAEQGIRNMQLFGFVEKKREGLRGIFKKLINPGENIRQDPANRRFFEGID